MGSGSSVVTLVAALAVAACGTQATDLRVPAGDATQSDGGLSRDSEAASEQARTAFRISPDGAYVSYLRRSAAGVGLYIVPVSDTDAERELVAPAADPIVTYEWAHTNARVVYERAGHVYSVAVDGGATVDLTPAGAPSAALHSVGPGRPGHALIDGGVLYVVDVETGEAVIAQQDAGFDGYVADHSLRPVLAYRERGAVRIMFRVGRRGAWQELGGASSVVGIEEAASRATVLADHALLSINLRTGTISDIAEDVTRALVHPRTGAVQAYEVNGQWHARNDDIAATLRRLVLLLDGRVDVVSRSIDDARWLVTDGRRVAVFDRSAYTLTSF